MISYYPWKFESDLGIIRAAVASWPSPAWHYWFRYTGSQGDKSISTCRQPEQLPWACSLLLSKLATIGDDELLGDAFPDLSLYGAGLCQMAPGSRLPLHLDSDHHPTLGWERAASAILFLTACNGGELRFPKQSPYDPTQDATYKPKPGAAVLFSCTESSYHEVLPVLDGPPRLTLSLFFWRYADPNKQYRRSQAEFQEQKKGC